MIWRKLYPYSSIQTILMKNGMPGVLPGGNFASKGGAASGYCANSARWGSANICKEKPWRKLMKRPMKRQLHNSSRSSISVNRKGGRRFRGVTIYGNLGCGRAMKNPISKRSLRQYLIRIHSKHSGLENVNSRQIHYFDFPDPIYWSYH